LDSERSETLTNEQENEVCLAECGYFNQGAKRMAQDLCNRNAAVDCNLILPAMVVPESRREYHIPPFRAVLRIEVAVDVVLASIEYILAWLPYPSIPYCSTGQDRD